MVCLDSSTSSARQCSSFWRKYSSCNGPMYSSAAEGRKPWGRSTRAGSARRAVSSVALGDGFTPRALVPPLRLEGVVAAGVPVVFARAIGFLAVAGAAPPLGAALAALVGFAAAAARCWAACAGAGEAARVRAVASLFEAVFLPVASRAAALALAGRLTS